MDYHTHEFFYIFIGILTLSNFVSIYMFYNVLKIAKELEKENETLKN